MKKRTEPPASLDATKAPAVWAQLESDLQTIETDALLSPRVDLQRVAALAYSIAERDKQLPRRALFDKLISVGLLPPAVFDSFTQASLAAWHARQQQLTAVGVQSNARLPEGLEAQALTLRSRMLSVLEYHLGTDTSVARELAAIRADSGHLDLANDLTALAKLYRRPSVKSVIEHDRTKYRAKDASSATSYANDIFKTFGLSGETNVALWTGNAHRAWTHLSRTYDTLANAGRFLFAGSEDTTQTYPNLIAAVRAAASANNDSPEPAPTPEPAPAPKK